MLLRPWRNTSSLYCCVAHSLAVRHQFEQLAEHPSVVIIRTSGLILPPIRVSYISEVISYLPQPQRCCCSGTAIMTSHESAVGWWLQVPEPPLHADSAQAQTQQCQFRRTPTPTMNGRSPLLSVGSNMRILSAALIMSLFDSADLIDKMLSVIVS
jgi:hypothetical protein